MDKQIGYINKQTGFYECEYEGVKFSIKHPLIDIGSLIVGETAKLKVKVWGTMVFIKKDGMVYIMTQKENGINSKLCFGLIKSFVKPK